MPDNADTWEKPRSHGTGLTEQEIQFVKDSYIAGLPIRYVAEKLKCASRTVTKYYGFFREEGVRKQPSIKLRAR